MFTLKYLQKIPLSLEESWDFFSSPKNLKILTPEHLGFEILNDLGNKKMYPGQIITYNVRPILNIPLEWVTEITHVQEPNYFVDEQRFGPYKFWHHEHHFKPIPNG
ncbi:MAG: SRPBCC family protein, partial [Parachlamydiaceae bacterium]|nr:SRPBCC family protein [Parachlamydiaceae bacterium]